MVVGAPLEAREEGPVDTLLQVPLDGLPGLGVGAPHAPPVEDEARPGAPEGLVGGGGHHMRVVERRGEDTGRNQAADVGHVRKQQRVHRGACLEKGFNPLTSRRTLVAPFTKIWIKKGSSKKFPMSVAPMSR